MLLHDDGTRLWAMRLDGSRRVLWRHPPVGVTELAVAPGGRRAAVAITMRVHGGSGWGLYELRRDGSVRLVDAVGGSNAIISPVFARTAPGGRGAVRLSWIRGSQQIDGRTGRFRNRVMTLTASGPRRVRIPLRYGESPVALTSYPGSSFVSMVLFRRDNIPTRYVDLRSDDALAQSGSSRLWGSWAESANSDVNDGIAWLTPRDYVAAVGQQDTLPRFRLERFRVGCEYFGGHAVAAGTRVGESVDEALWQMVALDARRVLAIRRRDVEPIVNGRRTWAPWSVVDTKTGEVHETPVRWTGAGVWASVRARLPAHLNADPHCARTRWSYP